MKCDIQWNVLSLQEWEGRFSRIRRSTLLQSYYYAQANAGIHGQRPRWGVIRIDGVEAGLVQIFEVSILGKIIHAVMLDRGPLWFDGFGRHDHIKAFLQEFAAQFPRRIGRKRRIICELPDDGFRCEGVDLKQVNQRYETIWIDLKRTPERLRKALKKSWRGSLQKAEQLAEKSALSVEWDDGGTHAAWLLQHYAVDRAIKKYDGPSPKMLRAMIQYGAAGGNVIIGRAVMNGDAVAGILIFRHGISATYQIGFNTPKGRDVFAHHFLLWESLSMLQSRGVYDFDLGGINDDTAKGVKAFKQGLGGDTVCLPHIYT